MKVLANMKRINVTAIALVAIVFSTAINADAVDATKPAPEIETKLDGLVAYWNFDEPGESDVCIDSSGNGYDATPNAAIKRVEGKFGSHAISLAGGQVFQVSEKMPPPSTSMSISAWVKPNQLEGRQYIFTYLPTTPETHGEYEYALHLDKGGEPRFWVWGRTAPVPGQEKWGLICKSKLPTDGWSHVVVTIGDPTGETSKPSMKEGAVNKTFTMYLNGEVVTSSIYPVPPFLPGLSYCIGGKPAGEVSLAGEIDELMVFNKTLTSEEVVSLFKNNALATQASE